MHYASSLVLAACALKTLGAPHRAQRRGVSTDPTTLAGNSYDYVIVGGGTAGLTLANRLSANSANTVAVIEAGANAYDDSEDIRNRLLSPALAYIDGLTGTQYDWQFSTTAQSQLNGRTIAWPRGKTLGGSSAINGLFLVQASAAEYNAWAELIGDNNWARPQAYASRKKAQNYEVLPSSLTEALSSVQNTSAWGENGPIHFGFPPSLYTTQDDAWIPTFEALGIPAQDPGGGNTINAIDSTTAVNPSNYTRSYSYTGYLLPIQGRSNLNVLTGYTVTQVLFDGTTATGVSYAQSNGGQSYSVNATKEVILCGGTVSSPQLLMVSGVGPNATLQQNGINVVASLPGVGQGLREHIEASIVFNVSGNVQYSGDSLRLNPSFAAQQLSDWENGNASNSLYSVSNHMIAMLNLSTIMGGSAAAQSFLQQANASLASYAATLGDSTVQAGYKAVSEVEINTLMPGGRAVIEMIQANNGVSSGSALTMGIQVALQRPFSRGSITINSASVFDNPTINPNYLSNSVDMQVLVNAFEFARNLSYISPLSGIIDNELSPGSSVQSDADWENFLKGALTTEYSPFGTCAMLPLSLGGVVDSQMRVYGTQNLRVVDASIIPVNIAAHGCAPTYGIGENAAEIILGTVPSSNSSTTSGTKASGSASASKSSVATRTGLASASASGVGF